MSLPADGEAGRWLRLQELERPCVSTKGNTCKIKGSNGKQNFTVKFAKG